MNFNGCSVNFYDRMRDYRRLFSERFSAVNQVHLLDLHRNDFCKCLHEFSFAQAVMADSQGACRNSRKAGKCARPLANVGSSYGWNL